MIVEKENKVGHVTAHEIGHTFELSHVDDLTIVNGFWVEKRCNMGNYDILNQNVLEPCDKNMDAEDLMEELLPIEIDSFLL